MFVMLSVHTQRSVHERQKVEKTPKTTTTTTTITSFGTAYNKSEPKLTNNLNSLVVTKTILPNRTQRITQKLSSIFLPTKYKFYNKNLSNSKENLNNKNLDNFKIKYINYLNSNKTKQSIIKRITSRKYFNNINKNKIIYITSDSPKKSNLILGPIPSSSENYTNTESTSITTLTGELNNNRSEVTSPGQVPVVATILNDLSPTPGVVKIKNKSALSFMSPMIPKGLPSDTPDIKAMRYYRLWIYTCNAVLLMGVILFCGVAGKVLMADYKRLLVNDLNLGQPSFIYAYLALLVQSGFLQLIGCLGALRLSEKLLNAYWLLLLLLLIGDVVLGLFWMFKFDRIMETFEPILRNRFNTEYGNSNEFSDLWDRLQSEEKCCGVIGPQDYTNRTYPASCCTSGDITDQISVSRRPLASPVVFRTDELSAQNKNLSDITWSHVVSESKSSGSSIVNPSSETIELTKNTSVCKAVFPQGCRDLIATWLRNTADILFVIGYCVIAFLKLSFLGILRYEIKEMIQKIKLLQNETSAGLLEQELDQNQLTQVTSTSINGGLHTEPKVVNRDRERSRMSSGESERESLLIHDTPPNYLRNKHLYGCTEFGASPSGSGTALHGISIDLGNSPGPSGIGLGIGSGTGARSKLSGPHHPGIDSDANCPLVEDSSAAAAAKALNSNNYELNEFDTKGPTYSYSVIDGKNTVERETPIVQRQHQLFQYQQQQNSLGKNRSPVMRTTSVDARGNQRQQKQRTQLSFDQISFIPQDLIDYENQVAIEALHKNQVLKQQSMGKEPQSMRKKSNTISNSNENQREDDHRERRRRRKLLRQSAEQYHPNQNSISPPAEQEQIPSIDVKILEEQNQLIQKQKTQKTTEDVMSTTTTMTATIAPPKLLSSQNPIPPVPPPRLMQINSKQIDAKVSMMNNPIVRLVQNSDQ